MATRKPVVLEEEEEVPLEAPQEEVAIEMYRVVPEAPRIKALIYSEPGGGKTTLAASAQDHPALGPVLFANIEGGLISVAHRQDLHAVDITSTAALYALYRKLANGELGDIGTVVLDNITELQTLNLDEIVQAGMTSGKAKDKSRDSEDEIFQEDYGTSTIQLGRIFRWFKGLDINLIMTAHAKYVYPKSRNSRDGSNPDIDPTAVLPMLTQKLMKTVMGMVDYVWYMQYDPDTDSRMMLTRPDGVYQAKTRGPHFAAALGPVVTNPTMPELYDLLVKSESNPKKKRSK